MIDQQASRVPYGWAIELVTLDELVDECEGLVGLRPFMSLMGVDLGKLAHAFHEHERGCTLALKQSVLPPDFKELDDALRLTWWPVIVGHEYEPAHLEELRQYLTAALLELHLLRGDPVRHAGARTGLSRKMTSVVQQAKFIADATS